MAGKTPGMAAADSKQLRNVILASSAGTVIEWYDFYIFGALTKEISAAYFPASDKTAAFLATLAIFATGFIVRPFGALLFGRMGDLVGRKATFLLTLLMMGGATVLVGCVPTYHAIGIAAPILLTLLRLVQGLALGGEYGGAATYVAEHAPEGQRGKMTSYIQITATAGLILSLVVILICRTQMSTEAFADWGWRIPFFLSAILIVFSYLIRRGMDESPLFKKLKAEGNVSKNPLRDSFVKPENRRLVLLALFGATMGQGVVWYTGQFYASTFMTKTLNLAPGLPDKIMVVALLLATPFFVVFGTLSDRIGRKKLMMAGCLLAAIFYVPLFHALASAAGFDPANPTRVIDTVNFPLMVGIVWIMVFFVTMVYGPIAAFLVELFPTRIRYTSMSLPYHIGNGVFGGLVPFISTAIVGKGTERMYYGLAYPIAIAAITFVIGMLFLPEKAPIEGAQAV